MTEIEKIEKVKFLQALLEDLCIHSGLKCLKDSNGIILKTLCGCLQYFDKFAFGTTPLKRITMPKDSYSMLKSIDEHSNFEIDRNKRTFKLTGQEHGYLIYTEEK